VCACVVQAPATHSPHACPPSRQPPHFDLFPAPQAANAAVVLWLWAAKLAIVDGVLWAIAWAAEHFIEPVSRRCEGRLLAQDRGV